MIEITKRLSYSSHHYTHLELSDKTIMSLNYGNQILWPIYITIENIDTKIWKSQKQPRSLFLSSMTIICERSEDANNNNKD